MIDKIKDGDYFIQMALKCREQSDISNMLDCSFKAYEIFKDKNQFKGQIKSLNLIGIAYFYSSMYEESIKYLHKALNLLRYNKYDYLLSSVLNNMGEVYREARIFDEAIKYYQRAIEISKENRFQINLACIFSNMGEIKFLQKDNSDALKYFLDSHTILLQQEDMISLGEIENRIGKAYLANKNYDEAESILLKSLDRLRDIDNKYYKINTLISIGKLHSQKDSKDAIEYYNRALNNAEKVNSKKKMYEVCKLISEYYENIGDFKNALKYYKMYNCVNEEIINQNLKNKLEVLNIELINTEQRYEFEQIRNRLELELNNKENQLEYIKRTNEILEKKAYEDELTGIPNRRSFNISLNNLLKKPFLKDDSIAIFMMDIDNFKKYNDYWGHSQGDICIRKIANTIRNTKRNTDHIFARYGGEEFVYIAKYINYKEAIGVGDRIRNEVLKLNLYYMLEDKKHPVTISVGGVVGKISDFKDIDEMIVIADRELYKAKDMGRNKTIIKDLNINRDAVLCK